MKKRTIANILYDAYMLNKTTSDGMKQIADAKKEVLEQYNKEMQRVDLTEEDRINAQFYKNKGNKKIEKALQMLDDHIPQEFDKLRNEFVEMIGKYFTPKADDLDKNIIPLLENGVLTDAEIIEQALKFNNVTMARIFDKYAKDRNINSTELWSHLNRIGKAQENALQEFDHLATINRTMRSDATWAKLYSEKNRLTTYTENALEDINTALCGVVPESTVGTFDTMTVD